MREARQSNIVGAVGDRIHPRRRGAQRDDNGDTLAFLVLWPALIVAVLLLLVHAFIVTNAQAEADAAASAGLRAAWRTSQNYDFLEAYGPDPDHPGEQIYVQYQGSEPHEGVHAMAAAAQDGVAQIASETSGWRWWTPGATEVQSDWCSTIVWQDFNTPRPDGSRPVGGEPGWIRVVVSGEVFGPLAALWPDRLESVYAAATGPAVLSAYHGGDDNQRLVIPAEMPVC